MEAQGSGFKVLSNIIMGNYEEIKVWQLSKVLAVRIYRAVESSESLKQDFGLKDQIQRSSVSIPSNIAEGDELRTIKNSIRHFYIAKGSCAELITQLMIIKEIGKLEPNLCDELILQTKHIARGLHKLILARQSWKTES